MDRRRARRCICRAELSSAPIFPRFTLHGGRLWIFDFDPVIRTARSIGRAQPFGHDAFAAELAGVLENGGSVAGEMLVDHDAGMTAAEQLGQGVYS